MMVPCLQVSIISDKTVIMQILVPYVYILLCTLTKFFFLWGSVKMCLATTFVSLSDLGFAELLRSLHLRLSPNSEKTKTGHHFFKYLFCPVYALLCNSSRIIINPTVSFDIIPQVPKAPHFFPVFSSIF